MAVFGVSEGADATDVVHGGSDTAAAAGPAGTTALPMMIRVAAKLKGVVKRMERS
jgi:hypothetical protein